MSTPTLLTPDSDGSLVPAYDDAPITEGLWCIAPAMLLLGVAVGLAMPIVLIVEVYRRYFRS